MADEQDSGTTRRRFLTGSAGVISGSTALSAGLSSLTALQASAETSSATAALQNPGRRVVVGVMGVMRGLALANAFRSVPGVEVRYLSDVDSQRLESARESFAKSVSYEVRAVGDFRDILKDSEVDALIVAAPNHWHAPAAILACAAGKHAYVE
ncbi:MAG: Gfo/Idh/MocA family oxidoreductase, partial [Planctomyces sp.]